MMETASKTLFLTLFLALFSLPIWGQCPPASLGHHRVQKGETLYRISKKYQVSVDQICLWNGIQQNTVLNVCQELAITGNTTPATTPTGNKFPPKPATNFQQQQGGSHRIKPGETIAGLAELYGYTEDRFREFNGLTPTEPAWPDLVLKTSDCNCARPQAGDDEPVYVDSGTGIGGGNSTSQPNEPAPNYPTWEESLAAGDLPGNDPGNPFGEDPFTGNTPVAMDKTDQRINPSSNPPTAYNKEVEKITAPNSPKSTDKNDTQPPLSPEVKRSESGEGSPEKTFLSPEAELIRQNKNQAPTTTPTLEPTTSTTTKPTSSKDANYMTEQENMMVKEINLMRSIPSNYVKFVEDYKKRVALGKAFGTVEACDELIAELKKTSPLSILSPTECIYMAAKKHGTEQSAMGKGTIDHIGKDGSYPSDRIKRECPDMVLGGENLASGLGDVRDVVIMLLVDAGIDTRGHRRTLLDPTWKYVACYNAGQGGIYKEYWVQNFGK